MAIGDLILFISIGLFVVGIILYFVWYFLVYKFFIIERQIVRDRIVIRPDKARIFRDKNHQLYWRLRKEKDKERKNIPIPPSEAIDLTIKGKKFFEFYRLEDGQIIPIKDDNKIIPYPKDLLSKIPKSITSGDDVEIREESIRKWKEETIRKYLEDAGAVATFKPLSTEHRQLLISNYKEAHARKKPRMMEHVPLIASLAALVILVLGFMLFYGEIAEPVLKANEQQKTIREIDLKIVEILERIEKDVQSIPGETEKGEDPPN